jgi:hypothetical protein
MLLLPALIPKSNIHFLVTDGEIQNQAQTEKALGSVSEGSVKN